MSTRLADGNRVLLAEGDAVNRRVLTLQLRLAGFEADCADDGLQALEKFKAGRHCLVLIDLRMPGLDGHELAAAIRAHECRTGARRTPIIALTASLRSGEVEHRIAADLDDSLARPATMEQLARKLGRWLLGPGDNGSSPLN